MRVIATTITIMVTDKTLILNRGCKDQTYGTLTAQLMRSVHLELETTNMNIRKMPIYLNHTSILFHCRYFISSNHSY